MTDRNYLFGKTDNNLSNDTRINITTTGGMSNESSGVKRNVENGYGKNSSAVNGGKIKTITLGGRGCETTREGKKQVRIINWE